MSTTTASETGRKAAQRSVIQALLIALSLTSSAGCSLVWPRAPATPPPMPVCPQIQCLDRALRVHPGLEIDAVPRTCSDATVIAIDALTALRESQAAHAELVLCVQSHNRDRP